MPTASAAIPRQLSKAANLSRLTNYVTKRRDTPLLLNRPAKWSPVTARFDAGPYSSSGEAEGRTYNVEEVVQDSFKSMALASGQCEMRRQPP